MMYAIKANNGMATSKYWCSSPLITVAATHTSPWPSHHTMAVPHKVRPTKMGIPVKSSASRATNNRLISTPLLLIFHGHAFAECVTDHFDGCHGQQDASHWQKHLHHPHRQLEIALTKLANHQRKPDGMPSAHNQQQGKDEHCQIRPHLRPTLGSCRQCFHNDVDRDVTVTPQLLWRAQHDNRQHRA